MHTRQVESKDPNNQTHCPTILTLIVGISLHIPQIVSVIRQRVTGHLQLLPTPTMWMRRKVSTYQGGEMCCVSVPVLFIHNHTHICTHICTHTHTTHTTHTHTTHIHHHYNMHTALPHTCTHIYTCAIISYTYECDATCPMPTLQFIWTLHNTLCAWVSHYILCVYMYMFVTYTYKCTWKCLWYVHVCTHNHPHVVCKKPHVVLGISPYRTPSLALYSLVAMCRDQIMGLQIVHVTIGQYNQFVGKPQL